MDGRRICKKLNVEIAMDSGVGFAKFGRGGMAALSHAVSLGSSLLSC
jgi:hypothetical protein